MLINKTEYYLIPHEEVCPVCLEILFSLCSKENILEKNSNSILYCSDCDKFWELVRISNFVEIRKEEIGDFVEN